MIPLVYIGSVDIGVGVRIERLSDHTYFDPSDGKFKPELASLIPLPPYRPTMYRSDLAITNEFKDGRYAATYFSLSDLHALDWVEFDIVRGRYEHLSVSDIARRIMDSRIGAGTVREALEKIDVIYDWIMKQA